MHEQTSKMLRCGHNEKHPDYPAVVKYQNDKFTAYKGCPACEAEEEDRQTKDAARKRAAHIESLLDPHNSGLMGRFASASFASYTADAVGQARAKAACERYVEDVAAGARHTLFLLGAVGNGKSHLGSAMVRAFILARLLPAEIVSLGDIGDRIRYSWIKRPSVPDPFGDAAPPDTEDGLLWRWSSRKLLVIDDVGAMPITEHVASYLFRIVDARYVSELPTVIASNLTQAALQAALGERTFDRLREGARRVVFDWQSHRGQA